MDDTTWASALAHRDRLLRIAGSRGVSADDAEDVVQEALARCAEFAPLDAERVAQFLTTVTLRLCADVHRRDEEPMRARRWLVPLLHHEPDPADVVCRDHGAEWVASLVEPLPGRQRRVLFDRARGLTIQQIARRHQLSYKAVESALSRARATVRSRLAASASLPALVVRARWVRRLAFATSEGVVVTAVVVATFPAGAPDAKMAAPPPALDRPSGGPSVRPARRPMQPSRPHPTARTAVPPTTAMPDRFVVFVQPTAGHHDHHDPLDPADLVPPFRIGPIQHEDDGNGLVSRPMQCLRQGVQINRIQCRYPGETESS